MANQYLIPFLSITALTLSVSPIWGQVNNTPNITFTCEKNKDMPTTVATNHLGQSQTIFNWKQEAFSNSLTSHKLCDRVTQKLNHYSAEGNDLSLLVLQPNEQAGLPTICATKTGIDCDLVLFTLAPAEEPINKACETLKTILNLDFSQTIQETTRNWQNTTLFSISIF